MGLDDTPEGRARILRNFVHQYGDKGLLLLNAHLNSGGRVLLKDLTLRSYKVGFGAVSVDTDDEALATENLLAGLLESIGQFSPEEKVKGHSRVAMLEADSRVRPLASCFGSIGRSAFFIGGPAGTRL